MKKDSMKGRDVEKKWGVGLGKEDDIVEAWSSGVEFLHDFLVGGKDND